MYRAPCAPIRGRIARITPTSVPACAGGNDMTTALDNLLSNIVAAVVFALIGVVLFIIAFMVFDKLTPGSLWKELLEDQNTALGVLMGCVAIGLAIILAAAIH